MLRRGRRHDRGEDSEREGEGSESRRERKRWKGKWHGRRNADDLHPRALYAFTRFTTPTATMIPRHSSVALHTCRTRTRERTVDEASCALFYCNAYRVHHNLTSHVRHIWAQRVFLCSVRTECLWNSPPYPQSALPTFLFAPLAGDDTLLLLACVQYPYLLTRCTPSALERSAAHASSPESAEHRTSSPSQTRMSTCTPVMLTTRRNGSHCRSARTGA
ncbi:uncharacterized protein V1518DRAFT_416185 [Limtongia smithiae]|uniref:uncharacterized protein n=1 Tax=Limtongia smithiae TaxID=1125753 RepID=UPI0034CD94B6